MRRIHSVRDIRTPVVSCILGPIRILDVDPQASEWSPARTNPSMSRFTVGDWPNASIKQFDSLRGASIHLERLIHPCPTIHGFFPSSAALLSLGLRESNWRIVTTKTLAGG